MVLSFDGRGGGVSGAPTRSGPSSQYRRSQAGAQTLELALIVPAIVILLVLLVQAAWFGVDAVTVQALAREAARAAAVGGDDAARAALAVAVGRRAVELHLSPPASRREVGGLVTAEVRLRSEAFAAVGVRPWIPARATMRVEDL